MSEALERLQDQVADRTAVNWDALDPEGFTTEELDQVALLRLLDAVGSAHNTFQTSDEFGEPAAKASAMSDDTLESWGRYRLDQAIGRGGFGTVYRAWDPDLEMAVAIKIIRRGDLIPEGRMLAKIRHPNVVRVLTVEEHAGQRGLVMELLRGDTLERLVSLNGAFNEREAMLIGEDVCRALAAVHAEGVIHRDIKARNVMRERAGRIVLMDFGAGMRHGVDDGRVVGTLPYMAPELIGGGAASKESDTYAVGALLFFLVSGRHPVEGASVDEFKAAHASGSTLRLLDVRADLPMPFVHLVERALSADPRNRFATAAELLEALAATRGTRRSWKQAAATAVVGMVGFLAVMTAGGMLTSAAFNATLGRADFATESFADWFRLGRRSLLMPVALALMAAGVVGLAAAARRMAVALSSRAHTLDRSLASICAKSAKRLALHEPGIASCWLILLSSLAGVLALANWWPLFAAVSTNVTTAPADVLEVLSPAFADFHTGFRLVLALITIANLAAWYGLRRMGRSRGRGLPAWVTAAELAIVVLLFGSMQLPYRLVYDNDEFPMATWRGQRCYVMGERREERLLFCPSMMPRNQRVLQSDVVLLGTTGSMFDAFIPQSPRR